ncbi:NmrA family transcriptional regulator [Scytonema hofmannii PCC 7110]|uniref:NmrA family transcriptional regulator n=1 Tax=Scytonema hofmannii PCC 7110 TaxID=128403 RepID=A0A139WWA5_9CYAN|nr:SDR family oxidoreductase [Scytonema hofmannii]KYC36719.1 NmrA family transcriptional regulator [Scytonema hofmannii PCC 7110]
MKIVVIGGSGLIGKKLVSKLQDFGHEAVAASPSSGVNAVTGEGLAEVLVGAQVVVDVTNSPSFEDAAVLEFFLQSSRNLLAAEADVGVAHHIVVSIVGADRIPDSGYMRAKVAQEKLIQSAGIPYTILRATQFFEFIETIVAQFPTDGQTVRLPSAFIQPILSEDVADALVDITLGAPVNGIIDLAGPDRFRFEEIIRQFLSATHDSRQVVVDSHARYFGAALNDRSLVPSGNSRIGSTRFEDWLNRSIA